GAIGIPPMLTDGVEAVIAGVGVAVIEAQRVARGVRDRVVVLVGDKMGVRLFAVAIGQQMEIGSAIALAGGEIPRCGRGSPCGMSYAGNGKCGARRKQTAQN